MTEIQTQERNAAAEAMAEFSHADNAAQNATNQEGEAKTVALSQIHKREGHNPRRIKSSKKRDDLRESIKRHHVLQPILVRPHPEKDGEYELVAGETRLDICVELEFQTIPVLVRAIEDRDLVAAATTENLQRSEMTPADEGRAAQLMLAEYDDRDEVCRMLGWTAKKLDARIQLTHCIEPVSQALMDGLIKLGHAELLSSLREKSQNDGLKMILNNGLSVEDFRAKIEALSLKLAVAPFDLTDCQNCPHNSSKQASLFGNDTSAGNCLNKSCFDAKTEAHFKAKKEELAENYNNIALFSEIPANTSTIIATSGKTGVGTEQVKACQSCEHFYAVIDTRIGNKARVIENVCRNLTCHKEKVAEYQNLIATDAPEETVASAKDSGNGKATTGKPSPTKQAAGSKKAAPAKAVIPESIRDRHHQVHRDAAASAIIDDEKAVLIVSILSLVADSGVKTKSLPEGFPYSVSGKDRAKAAEMLDTMDAEALKTLQRELAATAINSATGGNGGGVRETTNYGSLSEWYTRSRKCDLTKHFCLDKKYLEAFTKPVIADLLDNSGFKAHYIAKNDEKAYKKLVGDKKSVITETATTSGFDYAGWLPAALKPSESTQENDNDSTPK